MGEEHRDTSRSKALHAVEPVGQEVGPRQAVEDKEGFGASRGSRLSSGQSWDHGCGSGWGSGGTAETLKLREELRAQTEQQNGAASGWGMGEPHPPLTLAAPRRPCLGDRLDFQVQKVQSTWNFLGGIKPCPAWAAGWGLACFPGTPVVHPRPCSAGRTALPESPVAVLALSLDPSLSQQVPEGWPFEGAPSPQRPLVPDRGQPQPHPDPCSDVLYL